MATRAGLRTLVIYGAAAVLALLLVSVVLVPDIRVAVVRRVLPGVCMIEELKTIPNLAGMEFQVIYTNCDTLVKEDSVSVYVSNATVRESLLARWANRKTRIFSYVPGRSEVPSIEASGHDRIVISIPDVSSIQFQSRKWRNVAIDYKIGQIYYPNNSATEQPLPIGR